MNPVALDKQINLIEQSYENMPKTARFMFWRV